MLYRKVKMIEEETSAIDVGCWNFDGDWDSTDDKKSIDIVHEAIGLGINFFNVAPVYGWGHSEKVLGIALKKRYLKDKVLIASEGGLLWNDAHETTSNLSEESLVKEIDQILTKLQTGHINIYQMHWPDPDVPLEETAEALEGTKRAEKICYVGPGNFSRANVEKIVRLTQAHCQQSLYNTLERDTTNYYEIPLDYRTEEEVPPAIRKRGQAPLSYNPLFQGLPVGKLHTRITFSRNDIRNEDPRLVGPQFEQYLGVGEELENLADGCGKPMDEVALDWPRQKPEVTSIIGGASSIQQLEQNIHCLIWSTGDEVMGKIGEIIAPFENL